LNALEWSAIETLFADVQGRRDTFTLLEPAGNLLKQSEAFEAEEWDNGPVVGVTAGVVDPLGGTGGRALTNGSPSASDVAQTLAVPGDFAYVVSVWARAGAVSTVRLFAQTVGGSVERAFALTGAWRRIEMPVALGLATESVTFGVRLDGGVDLFGMQVDAQLGAGGYQKTGADGGVYPKARFGLDELVARARGTDVFDVTLRMLSKGN
jgi:hypothetical protein